MEINFTQIILQALNFGILLFVLTKFLYKPILKIIEQRAQKIDQGLTAAEKNIAEREKLELLKKQELKKAEITAAKIVEVAKNEAEKVAKTLLETARADTAANIQKEEAAFHARLNAEEETFKDRAADLVVSLSKSVLVSSLSPENQKEVLDNEIKALSKLKIS